MAAVYSPVHYVEKYEFVGILTDYENYTFSKTSQSNKSENACFRFIRSQWLPSWILEKNGDLPMLLSQFVDS